MQKLHPRGIRGGTHPQILFTASNGDAQWVNIGDILGDPDDGLRLDDLIDVNAPTPADLDSVLWDEATGRWVAGKPPTVAAMNDLTDVDTETNPPTIGDRLEWDGTNWVPGDPPTRTALVPLTTVLAGEPQLVWDGDDQLVMTEVLL